MAGSNRTEAYDLSLFEEQVVRQKIEPIGDRRRQLKKAPERPLKPQKTPDQREWEATLRAQRRAYELKKRRALKAAALAAVWMFMLAVVLMSRAKSDELEHKLDKMQSQIEIAEGENVRLNTSLDAMVSLDRVDTFAEDVLGMVKAETYQITYIDMSEGDEILLSGGREKPATISVRLKEMLAYLQ